MLNLFECFSGDGISCEKYKSVAGLIRIFRSRFLIRFTVTWLFSFFFLSKVRENRNYSLRTETQAFFFYTFFLYSNDTSEKSFTIYHLLLAVEKEVFNFDNLCDLSKDFLFIYRFYTFHTLQITRMFFFDLKRYPNFL